MDMKVEVAKYIELGCNLINNVRRTKKAERVSLLLREIDVYNLRDNLLGTLNIGRDRFLVSSDYPQDDGDIDILVRALRIDERIIYLTSYLHCVRLLKDIFHDRVFEVNMDSYMLAFSVDIHFYFWDRVLYDLLEKYGKNFWPMHPKNTPIYDKDRSLELPEYFIKDDREFLKFVCGDEHENIRDLIDWVRFWFGEQLNDNEIKEFVRTSGIDFFLLNFKYSVKRDGFLKRVFEQRLTEYSYYAYVREKNKKSF
jgi:hypothetical protein